MLPPSFFHLIAHPDILDLMAFASSISKGKGEADYLNQVNPHFWTHVFEFSEKVEEAKKSARKLRGK